MQKIHIFFIDNHCFYIYEVFSSMRNITFQYNKQ